MIPSLLLYMGVGLIVLPVVMAMKKYGHDDRFMQRFLNDCNLGQIMAFNTCVRAGLFLLVLGNYLIFAKWF